MSVTEKKIDFKFNIALTAIFFLTAFISNLFNEHPSPRIWINEIFEKSSFLGYISFLVILLGFILNIYITREFWNRFLSDIFKLREISFSESYAMTLLLSLLAM